MMKDEDMSEAGKMIFNRTIQGKSLCHLPRKYREDAKVSGRINNIPSEFIGKKALVYIMDKKEYYQLLTRMSYIPRADNIKQDEAFFEDVIRNPRKYLDQIANEKHKH